MFEVIAWGIVGVCLVAGLPQVLTDYVIGYRHSSAQAAREAPGGLMILGFGLILGLILWVLQ